MLISAKERKKAKAQSISSLDSESWKRQAGQQQNIQDIKGKKRKLTFIIFE